MMKAISKYLLPEFLTNPISRNLILIFIGGLITAILLVTVSVILLNQL